MAKILNRAILVAGEKKKVGTPIINIIELDRVNMVVRASGGTVPTDGDAGYAIGSIFQLTTGNGLGSTLYINEGSTSSADFNAVTSGAGGGGGGAGADSLNGAYENGRTIAVDSGAIIFNDATTGSANVLEFNKTGAGSGNILDIDMDAGIAAVGIYIDDGAGARTGTDISVKDDSTGTHSVISIAHSGSGAGTGFAWIDSYNGSDAAFGVKLTLDDDDGIDATAVQIVRGAGIRTAPAIDINEGSTGSANVIDIDVTGVYTGDVLSIVTSAAATGNMIFVNLDSAVAGTALHVEGSGSRTQPMIELATDATGSANLVTFTVTGAISGNVLDFQMDTTSTGNVIDIDMNASVGGKAIYIDAGNAARTADLIDILFDGTGNTDLFAIAHSNTGSGHIFNIDVSGTGSGNVIDIVYSGASTGDAVNLDMTSAVAGGAIVITGAGTRTQDLVQIEDTSAGSTHVFDINIGSTSSGNVFDVVVGASAFTGDVFAADLGTTATAASAIVLVGGAVARTVPLVKVTDAGTNSGGIMFDLNITGINAAVVFDIDATAATTGNVFDYATNSASTGTVFEVNMTNAVGAKLANYTLAGTRTADAITIADSSAGAVDVFQITSTSTSSGHIFNIDVDSVFTGNVIDIAFGTSAATGEAIKVVMGTNVAGSAMIVTGTGSRTDDFFKVDSDDTGNSHVFDINLTGISSSNVLDVTYTAASTGNAVVLAMDGNVAGQAIVVTSAATGVSGEGSALDITHTGDLVSGANLVDIISTGSPSATSHTVSIQQTTGAGSAGAYALYVNATGANVEAIKVDAGNVVFDEALTVTGTSTLGAVVYSSLNDGTTALGATALELNRSSDLSARLIAGGSTETVALATHADRITLLDTLAGTVVTLPAATGSGATYKFIVSVVATSNSHVIQVVGTDIMAGAVWFADSDTSALATAFVTAADSDTITLNRTTTGSVTRGEWIELTDALSGVWMVRGYLTNSGSAATPFSAAV